MRIHDEYDLDEFLDESENEPSLLYQLRHVLLVLVLLGGFVWLSWHAYNLGTSAQNTGSVPVISAEDKPYRVKPADPGGMDIPNRDKTIYEVLQQKKDSAPLIPEDVRAPKKILPLPETTDTVTVPADTKSKDFAEARKNILNEQVANQAKPVESIVKAPVEKPKPAPVKKVEPAQKTVAAPAKTEKTETATRATPKQETVTVSTSGNYLLQLGAFRSNADAEAAWSKVLKSQSDILKGYGHTVEKADVKDKGIFYRLQVVSFPDKDKADALCAKLKARKQGCYAVKR